MSRTFKDRPLRVRLHENMKKGLINHDHLLLSSEARVRVSSWADRYLSVEFEKNETKEISDYESFLNDLIDDGVVSHFEKEEVHPRPVYSWSESGFAVSYPVKTVVFKVYRLHTWEAQEYCTDAENYDPLTKTDKRNGKRAVCTPEWTRDMPQYYWKSEKNRNSRSSVRQALKKALREIDLDDLEDEGYSDSVYEVEYGRKIWMD